MSKILAASTALALVLSACQSSSVPTFREELPGTCWRLERLDGEPVVEGTLVTLCFEEDERVSGTGGCNQYFAPVRYEGDVLTIGPIGSTRMACEAPVLEQEQLFFLRLERARRWLLAGDELLLFGDEPKALRFERWSR